VDKIYYDGFERVEAIKYDQSNYDVIEAWLTEWSGYGWDLHRDASEFEYRRGYKVGEWVIKSSDGTVSPQEDEPTHVVDTEMSFHHLVEDPRGPGLKPMLKRYILSNGWTTPWENND